MSAEIDVVTPCGSYLEITFRGEWGGTDFLRFLPEVFITIKNQKLRRVLLDFSEVRFQSKILFEHEFGVFLDFELPRSILFAVVVPTGALGSLPCLQSVAHDRGSHLLVSGNQEEAADWLSNVEHPFIAAFYESRKDQTVAVARGW